MRLYRSKIPLIAKDTIDLLVREDDIEVTAENRPDAEEDLEAIMEEFSRRDMELRNRVRDYMSDRQMPFSERGRVRKRMAEEMGHPLRDDVERFLCRQFIECMMISRFVEEVYADDTDMYKKVMGVLRSHDVNEEEIREEALTKIKNVKEGSVDYEIALQDAVRDVKKRRGL